MRRSAVLSVGVEQPEEVWLPLLAFWAVEGITVAGEQWFGHRADPASSVASAGAVMPFTVMSIIGVGVLWVFLRHVDSRSA